MKLLFLIDYQTKLRLSYKHGLNAYSYHVDNGLQTRNWHSYVNSVLLVAFLDFSKEYENFIQTVET